MLARGDDIHFLDFDSFAVGDPEQDLAEFIVALRFAEFDAEFARAMALALLESYCACAAWKVAVERLDWYARVEYVTRAYRFYRQQRPGWADALQRWVSSLPGLEELLLELARLDALQSG